MTKRIAKEHAAYAVERDGGWTAHYAPAGGEVRSISDDSGQDYIYGSQDEAQAAAAVRLIEVLNARAKNLKRRSSVNVDRIDGPALADRIAELGLNPAQFADIVGMRGDHLHEMLTGKNGRKVSPQVELLATLFADSVDALKIARS